MESATIVNFNNETTFQTTLKGEFNVSVHELALHAMRDRCLLLQRRINVLENDNMRLKLDASKANESALYVPLQDEKTSLLQKIAELNKQKSQLMHHVFMVSCENKNLWNKLSSLKAPLKTSKEYTKPPLQHTNTYINNISKASTNYQDKYTESSLEEISLKLINSYIQEKSQLVDQYEQMAQLQYIDDDVLNMDSIGFTFVEDPPTDSLKEILSQTEKLQSLKKDLVQQERDLKLVISRVETVLREGYKCPTCIASNAKVISSEHKEIETSDSLVNWATPVDSSTYNNNFSELNNSVYKKSVSSEKEVTEELCDKICPMCGQTFQKDVAFNIFQSHVENHFMGDPEIDSIIDNFENIPNSLDNNVM